MEPNPRPNKPPSLASAVTFVLVLIAIIACACFFSEEYRIEKRYPPARFIYPDPLPPDEGRKYDQSMATRSGIEDKEEAFQQARYFIDQSGAHSVRIDGPTSAEKTWTVHAKFWYPRD